ncbi:right-handed parallel beta-helix repeat-containing protein [Roseovarius arcticus]|uniref:right-handed parallel beta-helix repeat-containing protein n=1 Tax=Roseovarius arcticus TaxID=2547404 RepID=UPI0011103A36|nr:right-handed parallel beta-helix repeat-containing protein [Roseovarius arcticus]
MCKIGPFIPFSLVSLIFLLMPFPLAATTTCTDMDVATSNSIELHGQTIRTVDELFSALNHARGGETFLLAAGNYGVLSIKSNFRSPVTLRSADAKAMASFSEAYLDHASNITFDTIKFNYTYSPGASYHSSKFRVENSSDITFTASLFEGDTASGTGTAADGLGTGKGLVVKGSKNIDVVNSEFHSWWTGLTINTSSNIHVLGNNIHGIRSDGIKLGRIQTALVEKNYIHDFKGADSLSDHRDMIQIQRSSGAGVNDLTIRDNIFDMASGDWTQTIWAGRDRASANDPTNWHRNILIENNLIYNAHTHGISINLAEGLSVRRNSLIRVRRSNTKNISIPKIRVSKDSRYVVIEQNVVGAIGGYEGQQNWVVLNNAIIQDTSPNSAGFYDRQFIYSSTSPANGYNDYSVRLGSSVDRLNAGARLLRDFRPCR